MSGEALPAYIVLGSGSVGGCERRFFDIFRAMRSKGYPIGLICPSLLLERLCGQERWDMGGSIIEIPMSDWRASDYSKGLYAAIKRIPKGTAFHYPINCLWPLHSGRGDSVTMSIVDCHHVPKLLSAKKHVFWHALSARMVKRVDVLSPSIYRALGGESKKKMSLTPGGTSVEVFGPLAPSKERNVSLISRLVPGKGVLEFLGVLQDTSRILRADYGWDIGFKIFGDGELRDLVKKQTNLLSSSGVRIKFHGFAPMQDALASSSIVLSLQDVTNYPSRVVAEGLMAGRCVLVRDTGDSREFGGSPGIEYICGDFNALDLARAINLQFSALASDELLPQKIHETAVRQFSIDAGVGYFSDLLELESLEAK